MINYPKVVLKKDKENSIKRFHPWIFSGAVARVDEGLEEGDLVSVYSNDDEFLAVGHIAIGSIVVRILSFEPVEINKDFWVERLASACRVRREIALLGIENNNVCRLVHGEGDSLPGLIVDFYAGTAVIQAHSVGMYLHRAEIAEALKEVLGDELIAVYDKSEGTIPFKSGIEPTNGYLLGEIKDFTAIENGLKFKVDWLEGQKTGFFIDQRENRSLLERYSKGRSVLNMFCYTGGFSFYAMRGGANLVHSVDSSARAIEVTNENVELNFPGDKRHEAFATDAFKYLDDSDQKYDLIVLDPPAFAKHKKVLSNALKGYKRLNLKGFQAIKKGGIMFTFSCSQAVSKEDFRKAVFVAAANAGRRVRILHQLNQPADHPVNIFHPEGDYLKGLVLYVE
ncbi:class I SAM-dependent rRNA methyltransferase [Ancylomarina euxinus]|uniref:Class I SAM-dependent rRNA methyltransferase n=1 Tax=Ancylomarina euxinus TaxID=2283627 RepID=A0A425XX06_9BACT|nr:class I SAM-dependent rRNA methyltransferase [Ancylomarina euxinus]MCZ4696248.1 class I SAM-dependent rRNA methyltransferase [Ancylomarina euxinus]MUP16623.1 methyltransferase [Ancylomarina euxinus]RRG19184.1 class I SAM-dependent rRNA methyltransferase [Ancylomarina euxinus]